MSTSIICTKSVSNFTNLQEGAPSSPSEIWRYQSSKEGKSSCQCRPSCHGRCLEPKISGFPDAECIPNCPMTTQASNIFVKHLYTLHTYGTHLKIWKVVDWIDLKNWKKLKNSTKEKKITKLEKSKRFDKWLNEKSLLKCSNMYKRTTFARA